MSVFFIGDLHLGHRSIVRLTGRTEGCYRGDGDTVEAHDEWVIGQLMSVNPTRRTTWWILGDVAFDADRLKLIDEVPGQKRLVIGNHDLMDTSTYLKHFTHVYGTVKKYKMWLSHVPMHPLELFGKPNIHGHSHADAVGFDPRYLNLAIDRAPGHRPMELEELRQRFKGLEIE